MRARIYRAAIAVLGVSLGCGMSVVAAQDAKTTSAPAAAAAPDTKPLAVNVDNFKRAESDTYFAKFLREAALGSFHHVREPVPIEKQDVIRMNRDTLYSSAVVDLEASPATIVLPNAGKRFMSMQVINEDHYTPKVVYKAGSYTLNKAQVGTRYALLLVRTFADPNDPADLKAVHALQDTVQLKQSKPGSFVMPNWDAAALKRLRDALNALTAANGGIDSARMFGPKERVDPVQHLLGSAAGWGGNPVTDAFYTGLSPTSNDGKVVYKLTVGDVPVDGFWSISVYNKAGFFEKNPRNMYSVNNVTAARAADGSVTVQFGGCSDATPNCLPITPGWNYLVRLYRPSKAVLDKSWTFPEAKPASL
ncbi:MAG TPA: DUF1254 domain-containing protein [Polyangiales bacterium]